MSLHPFLTGATLVHLLRSLRVLSSGPIVHGLGAFPGMFRLCLEESGALFPRNTWVSDLGSLVPVYTATTGPGKRGPSLRLGRGH